MVTKTKYITIILQSVFTERTEYIMQFLDQYQLGKAKLQSFKLFISLEISE